MPASAEVHRGRSSVIVAVALCGLSCLAPISKIDAGERDAGEQTEWELVLLPDAPAGINRSGSIALSGLGTSNLLSGIWYPDGGWQVIVGLTPNKLEHNTSILHISDDDCLVGMTTEFLFENFPSNLSEAYLWCPNTGLRELPTPESGISVAHHRAGNVVGGEYHFRAYLWTSDGGIFLEDTSRTSHVDVVQTDATAYGTIDALGAARWAPPTYHRQPIPLRQTLGVLATGEILGSCQGSSSTCIWNPTTQQVQQIRLSPGMFSAYINGVSGGKIPYGLQIPDFSQVRRTSVATIWIEGTPKLLSSMVNLPAGIELTGSLGTNEDMTMFPVTIRGHPTTTGAVIRKKALVIGC